MSRPSMAAWLPAGADQSSRAHMDGRADNADDRSWRSATARSYISPSLLGGSLWRSERGSVRHDLGTGGLSPLRDRDRLGARAAAGRGLWDFSRPAVLDVAAGTGNVAIRAAQAGAAVVASDVTPENFDAGRRAAREAGVDLEWVEGDAGALPSPMGNSTWSPRASARCLPRTIRPRRTSSVRVCRPGGVIGMMNFTPGGAAGDFFRLLLAVYAPPPPPGAMPPLLWGTEDHVTEPVWRARAVAELTRHEYVETAASRTRVLRVVQARLRPGGGDLRTSLSDQPARMAELDAAFLQFIARWNQGTREGPSGFRNEYLLVIGRKRM